MKRLLLPSLLFLCIQLLSQTTDLEYERIKIGDARHIVSGLTLSPDNSVLAISSIQGFPFYLFDWKAREVIKEFNLGNWYAGSSIDFSANGKYILMNQLFYADFALNKDKEVKFDIIDAKTGKRVKRFDGYHAVAISPDEQFAFALSDESVIFWNLESNSMETAFNVDEATNAIAISPDGKLIAISQKLSEESAENIPQLQRDKKALKSALKYKQQVSVFDASTFKKLYTVSEVYDIIYKLRFSENGDDLFCLNIPHLKLQNNDKRQSYIHVIDVESGTPKRRGFTSQAYYEPDFKLSQDGKWLGVVSNNNRFLELHVYDFEKGTMEHRFQQSYRLFEKNDEEMIAVDSRIFFVFLPDNESILMTMGNHLIQWNFTKNE
jgi:WD40 repeat protein